MPSGRKHRAGAGALAALAIGLVPGSAAAEQPAQRDAKPAAARRSVVRFDDDMIRGDLQRPDGDLVLAPPDEELPALSSPPASFARDARRSLLQAADRAAGAGAR